MRRGMSSRARRAQIFGQPRSRGLGRLSAEATSIVRCVRRTQSGKSWVNDTRYADYRLHRPTTATRSDGGLNTAKSMRKDDARVPSGPRTSTAFERKHRGGRERRAKENVERGETSVRRSCIAPVRCARVVPCQDHGLRTFDMRGRCRRTCGDGAREASAAHSSVTQRGPVFFLFVLEALFFRWDTILWSDLTWQVLRPENDSWQARPTPPTAAHS